MENLLKNNFGKYIQIFADCIPVRGATKSAFYDLTREELTFLPTPYFDFLDLLEGVENQDLLQKINQSDVKDEVYSLLEFLFEFGFARMTNKPEQFPKIAPGWEIPGLINDAIIDFDKEKHELNKVLNELDSFGCRILQMRFFSNLLSLNEISEIIKLTMHKSIQGVELILKDDAAIKDNEYQRFIENHPIISSLQIHSANENRELVVDFEVAKELKPFVQKVIHFSTKKIDSESHCGIINLNNLSSPSVPVFFENKQFNGCLNRKISVDKLGNIKNCPSMLKVYGNIKTDSLETALNNSAFKKVWFMNKDQIDTCKDCELRYICSDCRAYTNDSSTSNAKPLKCAYNPYSGEWDA